MLHPNLTALPAGAEDLKWLYPVMAADFPPTELKSLEKLQRLAAKGLSTGWLLLEEDNLIGYAYFLQGPEQVFPLLDYYAILPTYRGQGYGSDGLVLLKDLYPDGFFLEAEDPSDAQNARELQIRSRRVQFYQRAGLVPCPFPNRVFSVRYLIHLWAPELPENPVALATELEYRAYRCQLSPQAFARNVQLDWPPKEIHRADE